MKNKFVTGVLTGAACALIAAALLFVVYFAGLPTNEAEASERYEQEVTVSPTGETQGVFSVSDDVMLEKLEYIKKMIADYSLYGATDEEMLEGVYRGLLWSIDDAYSAYYTEDEMKSLMESSSGYYCGIGVMVSQNVYNGIITVVKPFKDGPAYEAGVRKEDILIRVEDEEVTGVDLNEVLKEEQEAYEEAHEEAQKEIEEHNDFVMVMEEGVKEPVSAYEAYKNAATAEEILAKAEEYNAAYERYMQLAEGDSDKMLSLRNYLGKQNATDAPLLKSIYEIKAAYMDYTEKEQYSESWLCYNTEADTACIVLTAMDETTYMLNRVTILKQDGSTCEIDLSSIMTETTSTISVLTMNGDTLLMSSVDNADFKNWAFKVNETTATGTATTVTEGDHLAEWFMNSYEELNQIEPTRY